MLALLSMYNKYWFIHFYVKVVKGVGAHSFKPNAFWINSSGFTNLAYRSYRQFPVLLIDLATTALLTYEPLSWHPWSLVISYIAKQRSIGLEYLFRTILGPFLALIFANKVFSCWPVSYNSYCWNTSRNRCFSSLVGTPASNRKWVHKEKDIPLGRNRT